MCLFVTKLWRVSLEYHTLKQVGVFITAVSRSGTGTGRYEQGLWHLVCSGALRLSLPVLRIRYDFPFLGSHCSICSLSCQQCLSMLGQQCLSLAKRVQIHAHQMLGCNAMNVHGPRMFVHFLGFQVSENTIKYHL